MKKIFIFLLLFPLGNIYAQINFNDFFTDKVLRFDYMFARNSTNTQVFPLEFRQEQYYGGSKTQLIEPFDYGNFKYEVFDKATNKLIYSRGFCTLFQEWQATEEAKEISRSFHEVATMPFPKKEITFVMSERKGDGKFAKIYETDINPDNYFILRESPISANYSKVVDSGDPAKCVDIVFLAEGYTRDEMPKFRNDVKKMTDILFKAQPYNDYKDKINIWAVESPSNESGTDIPGENIYKNTVMNSSFYTFDVDRYLTTLDLKSVNDYAGLVPHDNIIILVNTSKYGGGGVYNYYSITAVDNTYSNTVFVHELGHSFAGLADEYYTSEVPSEEYYKFDVEPWEPNITTLVDFHSKWENLIDKSTPVPTPPEPKYYNTLGLFEGAGYSATNIYRPTFNCTMKSNEAEGFCPVCTKAIIDMINFYCE